MNAKETAIVFIEFQNDFCKPQGVLHVQVKDEMQRLDTIANARKLLDAAREKGVKVIHCPFVYDADWCAKTNAVGLLELIGKNRIFQPNTWGAAIIEELEPLGGEVVLNGKRGLSAFTNTELLHILKMGDYKNLLICGFLTNVCVQATAYSAYDRGLNTRIVLDACGSGGQDIQEYVEQNIAPILGGALNTADAIASLHS